MPMVKNPNMPLGQPAPTPVVSQPAKPATSMLTPRGTGTFDAQADLVRTGSGIADPGKMAAVKAAKVQTAAPDASAGRQAAVARGNMKNAADTMGDNARGIVQRQKRAISQAAQNSRSTGGITQGPSVFGPRLGTAGNPADNPSDFPFLKFT